MTDQLRPEDLPPLQRALIELEEAGFEAQLATVLRVLRKRPREVRVTNWTLTWRRRGSRWRTHAGSIDELGLLVLGWLEVRTTGQGSAIDYAEDLSR